MSKDFIPQGAELEVLAGLNVAQVIDANINRVSEGLRVIEEYTRFIAKDRPLTLELAKWRKVVNATEGERTKNLAGRAIERDMRAQEPPLPRTNLLQLLTANFKRAEEGLRVLEEYTGQASYNQARYALYQLEKEIILKLQRKGLRHGVYLITNEIAVLEQGLATESVALVQLRDKQATKREILAKAYQMKALAAAHGVPFVINDYLDIACLVDADGLHSGQDDLSIADQRQILGPHKIIGRTTHNLEQGLQAQAEGADYVSIGPLWETPSKPGRPAIGMAYLAEARTALHIPYVAIGGIDPTNVAEVWIHQPPMIAVVRAYADIAYLAQGIKSVSAP